MILLPPATPVSPPRPCSATQHTRVIYQVYSVSAAFKQSSHRYSPSKKSVTSYTLPNSSCQRMPSSGVRNDAPCTIIQQLSRELCCATSFPERTFSLDPAMVLQFYSSSTPRFLSLATSSSTFLSQCHSPSPLIFMVKESETSKHNAFKFFADDKSNASNFFSGFLFAEKPTRARTLPTFPQDCKLKVPTFLHNLEGHDAPSPGIL